MLRITASDQLYSAGVTAGHKIARIAASSRKVHEGHLDAVMLCDYNAALSALGLAATNETARAFQGGLDRGMIIAVERQEASRQ